MTVNFRIWIAGRGGQGVSFVGKLLSRCVYLENQNVLVRSDQDWAIRGGLVQTTVLVDEKPLSAGALNDFNWALLLHPEARAFLPPLAQDAVFLDAYKLELYKLSQSIGFQQGLNIALLGYFLACSNLCQPELVARQLKDLLGKEHVAVLPYNLELLEQGLEWGARHRSNHAGYS